MKYFFLFPLAAVLHAGCAQAQIVGKSVTEFKTTSGTTVHVGDTLRLGRGTLPTGEFQFVYVPANVFTGSKQVNFSSQLNNLTVRVKDLRFQHSKLYGDKTVAVIRGSARVRTEIPVRAVERAVLPNWSGRVAAAAVRPQCPRAR